MVTDSTYGVEYNNPRTNTANDLGSDNKGTCAKIAGTSSLDATGPLLQVPDDSLYIKFSS